jgi:hypothetical protein
MAVAVIQRSAEVAAELLKLKLATPEEFVLALSAPMWRAPSPERLGSQAALA